MACPCYFSTQPGEHGKILSQKRKSIYPHLPPHREDNSEKPMAFPTDSDLNAARKPTGGQHKEEIDNFQSIKKNLITHSFLCVSILPEGVRSPGITDSQELGIEPRFSEKAASVLKCWAISPTPTF